MGRDNVGLEQRLGAAGEYFDRTAKRLRQVAAAMSEQGAPPSEQLLEELTATRANFATLQSEIREIGIVCFGEDIVRRAKVATLPDLRRLLSAVAEEEERRARARETQAEALAMLDRVLALAHRDEPDSAALATCREQARILRATIADGRTLGRSSEVAELSAGTQAFAQLLTLVDERTTLTDARGVALMTSIAEAFDARLAVAALTGKLYIVPDASVAPASLSAAQGATDAPGGDQATPREGTPVAAPARAAERHDNAVAEGVSAAPPTAPHGATAMDVSPLGASDVGERLAEDASPTTITADAAGGVRAEASAPVTRNASLPATPAGQPGTVEVAPSPSPDLSLMAGESVPPLDASPSPRIVALARRWSQCWDTLPQAYLAATWLQGNGLPTPVSPTVLILAHHAFAPSRHHPGPVTLARFDAVVATLEGDPTLDNEQRPGLWAVGAGLVLLRGHMQALPWFLDASWLDGAPTVGHRLVDVLMEYWNVTGEALPVVRARLAAVAGNALPADEARRAAQAALNGLLARRLKFNLGVKLIAHARRDLAWLEHALRDADAASVPRLAEWAHHLDPERLLDSWADAVDPRHRTGVISKSRGALLRDLQSLRGAVLDWTTVVAPGHGAQDLLLQRQAFEALAATLAREAEDWYDAWGLTGATAQGQLLIVRLAEAVGLGRAIPDDRPQDNDRDGTER